MAKINEIFVAISLISVVIFNLLPNHVLCKPTGRNTELLDGNDFLSLFLDHNHPMSKNNDDQIQYDDNLPQSSSNKYSVVESSMMTNTNNNNVELNDDTYQVKAIMSNNEDELFSEDTSSNYGRRLNERMRNQKYIPKQHSSSTSTSTSSSTTPSPIKTNTNLNQYSSDQINSTHSVDKLSKKQIIKMVTSGSKIIFLEEMTPSVIESPATTSTSTSTTTTRHARTRKTDSDDIQVISISVSSTVGRSRKQKPHHQKPIDLMKFPATTSTTETIPAIVENSFASNNLNRNDDDKNSDFINRSHKSEFSIEESEPVTQVDTVNDSVNGESTNIHSILAPPADSKSEQQTMTMVINQSQSHDVTARGVRGSAVVSVGSSDGGTNNRGIPTVSISNTAEPTTISRMQRKQDKLVPFQTVIYHDTGFNKDGSAQPRSVSYSSIGQSIDELNAWKDLEGLLEAKQNVSESLRKITATATTSTTTTTSSTSSQHRLPQIYSQPEKVYSEPAKFYSEPSKVYGEPSKFYSEPSKIYSEPAKMYGQAEKQYGEPSKIYSEPAKIYSEPSKIYSEPAKNYGEPSKVYWPRPTQPPTTATTIKSPPTTSTTTETPPIQLPDRNSNSNSNSNYKLRNPSITNSRRVIFNLDKLPYDLLNAPESSKRLLVLDTSNGGAGRRLRPSVNPKSKSQTIDSSNNAAHDDESHQKNDADEDGDGNDSDNEQQHYNQHHYQNNHQQQQQQQHQYNSQNNHQQQPLHHQYQNHHHQHQFNHNTNNNQKPQDDDQLIESEMDIKINPNHRNRMENMRGGSSSIGNTNQRPRDHPTTLHQPINDEFIMYHHHHHQQADLVTKRPNYSISSITDSSLDIYSPTPEQNYEIEESVSVMTNGRTHGIVQASPPTRSSSASSGAINAPTPSNSNSDDSKTGYVVEGRNFRKYRVEEKTDDGFIVGEYGVVSHNDGGVRGVRYTADSNINPSLIHQALMKFLSL